MRVGRDNGRSFTWMTGLIFSIDSTSALSYPLSNLKKYNTLAAHISLPECIVLSWLWFLCQYSAESYQVVCAVSCKSCKKWQWQLFSAKKHISLFVTTFDLSQSSICYLSQFAKCHRRVQTARLYKKSPKTLILAGPPEKMEMCPLFTNISLIIAKQLFNKVTKTPGWVRSEPLKIVKSMKPAKLWV